MFFFKEDFYEKEVSVSLWKNKNPRANKDKAQPPFFGLRRKKPQLLEILSFPAYWSKEKSFRHESSPHTPYSFFSPDACNGEEKWGEERCSYLAQLNVASWFQVFLISAFSFW